MRMLIVAAVAGLLAISAFAQDTMPKPNQTPQRFEREIKKTVSANYLLFLPKDYDPKGRKRWPLIVFLHGAGERGTNLNIVAVHGPPKIVKERPDFPFVVVSPQCPSGKSWQNDVVLGLVDEILEEHKVDPARVYLTGLSMGGYGTWSLAIANPERFAAVAPICGGGDSIGILLPNTGKGQALKTLPVWAFHGGKDEVVRPVESERMIDALKRIGNNAKLTVYPDAGHDSWTATYNNQELYDWFLQHERPPVKKSARR